MTTLYSKAKALVRPLLLLLRRLVLQLFSHINPGDITIRHHFTQQPFRLHSYKHYGYWYAGAKREQTTMELFVKLINHGDVVVEVGGHIGYIAVYFSHLVGEQGRVIVFEPGPNNLPYLHQNTTEQSNVNVIEKAVGSSEGDLPFYMDINQNGGTNTLSQDWNERSYKSYKKRGLNVIYQTIMVPVVRLDSMLQTIPTVNFIKIDVEGAEVDVLNGGRELIQQHHPILMVACHGTAPALWDVLNGAGYWMFTDEKKRIHDASNIGGVNENYFCLHPHWHAAPLQAHFGIVES